MSFRNSNSFLPTIELIHSLLNFSDIKISKQFIKKTLVHHPFYPNIIALIDTLNHFQIENKPIKFKSEDFFKIRTPFIVSLEDNTYGLIEQIYNNKITLYKAESFKKEIIDIKELENILTGVAILFKNDLKSSIVFSSYMDKYLNQRTLLLIKLVCIPILIASLSIVLSTITISIYLVIKLIGLYISYLLFLTQINHENGLFKFCQVGKKISCNDVLKSKAANITKWLSLVDIGMIYFASTIVILIIGLLRFHDNLFFQALVSLSFFSAPFTIYSVYYQAIVIKKICPLCVLILFVLWLEILVGYQIFEKNVLLYHPIILVVLFLIIL